MHPADARRLVASGADFAILGRAAILHHDYPQLYAANPDFATATLPVTRDYLTREGLSPKFLEYMGQWKGFVAAPEEMAAAE
jgi:hypothetical protein